MNDQAQQLRKLKRQSVLTDEQPAKPLPIAALLGSKGGVGTTTLAVSLAEAVAKRLRKDPGDAPKLKVASCGTRIDDLACMTGTPQLTQLAGGSVPWRDGIVLGKIDLDHAFRGDDLAKTTDLVLADLGCWTGGGTGAPIALDQLGHLFLVTTEDTLAMMDTYACVKQLLVGADNTASGAHDGAKKITVVINQVLDEQVAAAAASRLRLTCQRFLGVELETPVIVPISESAYQLRCFEDCASASGSRLGASLDLLAQVVTAVMKNGGQPEPCMQL